MSGLFLIAVALLAVYAGVATGPKGAGAALAEGSG